jgi:hypothetical protein
MKIRGTVTAVREAFEHYTGKHSGLDVTFRYDHDREGTIRLPAHLKGAWRVGRKVFVEIRPE